MSIDWRTAPAGQRKAELDRIAGEMGDHRFFTGKELRRLPKLLGEGEQVAAFCSGFMDKKTWLIVLTDRRILFLDCNMFFGMTQMSIGLDKVNSIEAKTGLVFGELYIEDGANTHVIRNLFKSAAEHFAIRTREVMERRRIGSHGPDAPAADERLSALERLDALRRSGGLSEAEFAREKARLLG